MPMCWVQRPAFFCWKLQTRQTHISNRRKCKGWPHSAPEATGREELMSTEPRLCGQPRQVQVRQRQRNQGVLTILEICFLLSGLLDELQHWGSWSLYGGKSRVTEQYGVLAPCHGKGENGHSMSPVELWLCSPHTMDWLFGWTRHFL